MLEYSGVFCDLIGDSKNLLDRTLPYRTVDHAGLTKTAAARAAAEQFYNCAVLYDLDHRNKRFDRIVRKIKFLYQRFAHPVGQRELSFNDNPPDSFPWGLFGLHNS